MNGSFPSECCYTAARGRERACAFTTTGPATFVNIALPNSPPSSVRLATKPAEATRNERHEKVKAGADCAIRKLTEHFLTLDMGCPALHPNASENSTLLDSGPMTGPVRKRKRQEDASETQRRKRTSEVRRRVRIGSNTLDSLGRLDVASPALGVGWGAQCGTSASISSQARSTEGLTDEEELLASEAEAREEVVAEVLAIGVGPEAVAPRAEALRQSATVGHVLAVRELAVHVDRVSLRVRDTVVSVLLEEAALEAFEALGRGLSPRRQSAWSVEQHLRNDAYVGPPVFELAILVVLASHLVKGVRELVPRDGAERAKSHVLGPGRRVRD